MRTRAFIVIAVAALALAGCGNHNLVLKVDVLSYLDASQKVISVGDLPAGSLPAAIPIVPDATINLVDGLSQAAKVQSATLSLGVLVTATSGSGSGHFKLYLSDEDTDPLTTDPVMNLPVTFPGDGQPTIGSTDGNLAVAGLFTKKKLRMAVVLDGATIDPGGATGMTVTITKFNAIVIAGRKAF
jgi:hypothetical protein